MYLGPESLGQVTAQSGWDWPAVFDQSGNIWNHLSCHLLRCPPAPLSPGRSLGSFVWFLGWVQTRFPQQLVSIRRWSWSRGPAPPAHVVAGLVPGR